MNTVKKIVRRKGTMQQPHLHVVDTGDRQKTRGVISTVRKLMLDQYNRQAWVNLAEEYPWHLLSKTSLRSIALRIYSVRYGYMILQKILPLNALYFEDFEIIAYNWNNWDFQFTQTLMEKIDEVARYCNKVEHGRFLNCTIANNSKYHESWESLRHAHE